MINKGGSSGGGSDGGKKRGIEVRGIQFDGERPVSRIYGHSKIVIPGVDYEPDTTKTSGADLPGGGRPFSIVAKPRNVVGDHGVQVRPQVSKRFVLDPKFRDNHKGNSQAEKRWVKFGEEWTGDDAPAVEDRGVSSTVDVPGINKRIVIDPKFRGNKKGGSQASRRWVKFGEEWTGDAPTTRDIPQVHNPIVIDPKFRHPKKGGNSQTTQRWVKVGEDWHGDAPAA